MTQLPLAAIILAAGLGTRMRSARPKVLHQVVGRPMLHHVIAALGPLGADPIITVVGPECPAGAVPAGCRSVIQHDRRGTGDAARMAEPVLSGFGGTVLLLAGDVPLIESDTLGSLVAARQTTPDCAIALAGFHAADPTGYGRLLVDDAGGLQRIVEQKDASAAERAVTLCNAGIYAVDAARLFGWLAALTPQNAQGEYYLTDIIALARAEGAAVAVVEVPEAEVTGVNSRLDLARVEGIAQDTLRRRAMAGGATLLDPATTYFSWDTQLGRDVTVGPNVVFAPGVVVGDGVEIRPFCHLEGVTVEDEAIIGPFARLRPGSVVGRRAHVGNFVELKNAELGEGAKANHLSYLGDASIGAGANIGAGTITCNYDGFTKARTEIGAGAFIGSNSALVAPVTIGSGAILGAGTVIGGSVPDDALAVTRAEARIVDGGAAKFRAVRSKVKKGNA